MPRVGVVAHSLKSVGGGLDELRRTLAEAGVDDPLWYEVEKSRKAPRKVEKCLRKGVDLLLVWGGDGTVQRCIDAVVHAGAGGDVALAIIPAGTANLLASNLGIPDQIGPAVEVALKGRRLPIDVGLVDGEHFAVMAGMGFDALMIGDADKGLKERLGRVAYVYTGAKNLGNSSVRARVRIDGKKWFSGRASCILIGNVGTLIGGLEAFPDAEPSDALLEVGVVEAGTFWQWVKVLARTAVGQAERSPLVETTRARSIEIRLNRKLPYQLDGGARGETDHLVVEAKHHAVTMCVPHEAT